MRYAICDMRMQRLTVCDMQLHWQSLAFHVLAKQYHQYGMRYSMKCLDFCVCVMLPHVLCCLIRCQLITHAVAPRDDFRDDWHTSVSNICPSFSIMISVTCLLLPGDFQVLVCCFDSSFSQPQPMPLPLFFPLFFLSAFLNCLTSLSSLLPFPLSFSPLVPAGKHRDFLSPALPLLAPARYVENCG